MSVGVYINKNPKDATDIEFYFPVSSEDFFYSHWMPACKLLNLRWIPCFGSGINIDREDLPEIIMEIGQLKSWALKNLSGKELEYMVERLDFFPNKLPQAFTKENSSVFIG